jgi:UDP-N-acetylglucosamine diphosphorylase/glucosamine-1-phosphate N-acetyltransferase
MLQLVLSDGQSWPHFLPLTYTKPVAELRVGMLSFRQRWERLLGFEHSYSLTEDYLQAKFPTAQPSESLMIAANFLPTPQVIQQIKNLQLGEALVYNDQVVASRIDLGHFSMASIEHFTDITEYMVFFEQTWDLFLYNDMAMAYDFKLLTQGRKSQEIPAHVGVLGDTARIFIAPNVQLEHCSLNPLDSYIYLDEHSLIMSGSHVRGGLYLGQHASLKMGCKIYGDTSIGPHCKVGGEVNNSNIQGYSNKGHEGYLGNSVLGEWCNLGADTNVSNLKNNYSPIEFYSIAQQKKINTHLQFFGVVMGDHSKTAINTQINTGSNIGVFCNLFDAGFLPKHLRNFTWGGHDDTSKYQLHKALDLAQTVYDRRQMPFTAEDKAILKHVFEQF